jgi:hypothetical protein
LILPSIGFGLLYLYYGLLPAIVLHFAFDVVWFALPIFLADAPGIWLQQVMVVVMTLVPLGVVVWRRLQAGRWNELAPSDLNAAWSAPPAPERSMSEPEPTQHVVSARTRTIWYVTGAASLVFCAFALVGREVVSGLPVSRLEAASIARRALEQRGVTLDPRWWVLPTPDDGSGGPHEFVAQTAGSDRRKGLLGSYLPKPRWLVRVVSFEGDVADRAEEWRIAITDTGDVRSVQHTLPERRPGASLDEAAARRLAAQALAERTGLDVARGQAREVSARPSKLDARMDWTFTFTDATLDPLPQGEPRIVVGLAGSELVQVGRFVHVPEEWARRERAADTRNLILRIVNGVVFGGLLVSAAVSAVIAWSRRRYTPLLFVVAFAVMFGASAINAANGWPTVVAALQTAQPFRLQVVALIGLGLVGLTISAVLVGLAIGALPHRLAGTAGLPDRHALTLGIATGLFGAAAVAGAAWLRTPEWAAAPAIAPLGTVFPSLDLVVDPVPTFLMRTAVVLTLLASVSVVTSGWTRRRTFGTVKILVVGFLAAGSPPGMSMGGWLVAGALTASALWIAYVSVLRADLTMVPLALGTMMAIASMGRGLPRPFPGAVAASIAAALVTLALSWFWFRALRRARARVVRPAAATMPHPDPLPA